MCHLPGKVLNSHYTPGPNKQCKYCGIILQKEEKQLYGSASFPLHFLGMVAIYAWDCQQKNQKYPKATKLWRTGEDGLCCSSSAIQTRLGPSSLLEKWSETPMVFVVSFVLSVTP